MSNTSQGQDIIVQGRIVWVSGDLFQGKPKTNDAGQPIMAADGSPATEYGLGLAIPKMIQGQPNPQLTELMQKMQAETKVIYPSGQFPPDYAWKYKDGDGVDHNGRSFADRAGYAGHVVVACTTQIPIKFFKHFNGDHMLVNDGIKNGDYVNVQLNLKAHGPVGRGKAGMYVNPTAVQFVAEGEAIINAPSGSQIFGDVAPTYAGEMVAPTTPTMPQTAAMGVPANAPTQMPQQPMQTPQMPAQPAQAPQQPAQAPQGMPQQPAAAPNYGVLPQQHQPAQAPQQPAQAPQGMPPGMPGY